MAISQRILSTNGGPAVILIRLAVGSIFLSEGIQKFLFPDARGVGRFERMGYESAELIAPFVAASEMIFGLLLLIGLGTRLAAIPIMLIMITAIVTTKIPILFGEDMWGFKVRELSTYGFWSMAHEMRTDFSMLLGATFLLITGGGRWSLDRRLAGPQCPNSDSAPKH